ncbi:MAG: serine/threonine protein kinase [Magnetococcales bacterium]|nr:serine/threonine protein kinase [Magnetococcales bacterium]
MAQPQQLGRYTIETTIVEGPNNIIYKGYDSLQSRIVSLKTVRTGHLNSSLGLRLIERLHWESLLGARVSHPNIVEVYDYSSGEGQPFLVMEYLEGESLKEIFRQKKHFELPEIVNITRQVLAALGDVHQAGIVHRDIKPGNIILDSAVVRKSLAQPLNSPGKLEKSPTTNKVTSVFSDSPDKPICCTINARPTAESRTLPIDRGLVKISDFGIACMVGEEPTQSSRVVGTPSYMAPEQVFGTKIDGRCDLFSVGTILYELISGQKPFIASDNNSIMQQILTGQPARPSSLNSSIPKAIDSIVGKAMAKRPSERFQSVEEFLAALNQI